MTESRTWHHVLTALTVIAAAGVLLAMGRVPICECGYVELWHGGTNDAGNSQHLLDWYSPSHLIHGFLFYWLLRYLMPRKPLSLRLFVATVIEAAWEIAENSPPMIARYRSATIALGYAGDSVLNSVSDILMMIAGFLLASRLPAWLTVAIALGFEILTTVLIRDGLALNVLMLLWPVEAIRTWQGGV